MTPTERAPSSAGACPSAEEIGAYLAGGLSAADRARLEEHFASCEECYETVRAVAAWQEESAGEKGKVAAMVAGTVVPLDGGHEVRHRRRGVPMALAALLLVALAFPVYRSFTRLPTLDTGALVAAPPAAYAGDRQALTWKGESFKGGSSTAGLPTFERSFRLGVLAMGVETGLEAGDADLTLDAAQRIHLLLQDTPSLAPARRGYEDLLAGVAEAQPPFAPAAFREPAAAAEAALAKAANPVFFDLGRWTAAGRLAAIYEDAGYFQRPEVRRFAARLPRQKADVDPRVLSEVRAIKEILERASLDAEDLTEIRRRFEEILGVYYPAPASAPATSPSEG